MFYEFLRIFVKIVQLFPLIFQVVANFEMYRDATNLFRAKFAVTTDYDFTKAFEMFDNWYVGVQQKLHTNQIVETFHEIEVSNCRIMIQIQWTIFNFEMKKKKMCIVY